MRNNKEDQKLLSTLPTDLPSNYLESVNDVLAKDDLKKIRQSLTKGTPYEEEAWVGDMVEKYDLSNTLRGPSRPKSV